MPSVDRPCVLRQVQAASVDEDAAAKRRTDALEARLATQLRALRSKLPASLLLPASPSPPAEAAGGEDRVLDDDELL